VKNKRILQQQISLDPYTQIQVMRSEIGIELVEWLETTLWHTLCTTPIYTLLYAIEPDLAHLPGTLQQTGVCVPIIPNNIRFSILWSIVYVYGL